ncbi:MAG: hypothetical protein AB4063_07400 [Crocosphaera sp.]
MIDNLNWINIIRSIINGIKDYQAIISSLITAGTITFVGNYLIVQRERKQWAKEKIYNTYTSAIYLYSDLIGLTYGRGSDSLHRSEITLSNLIGYLSNLLIISSEKNKEEIKYLIDKTSNLKRNGLIQKDSINDLEKLRDKVIEIMKSDHRLKDLFNI